ncbi:MAG TPA: hypothetical protein VKE22_12010 [Haliangiales bacterium]|nr:hypothetical protein [Haliangiales bacterium]
MSRHVLALSLAWLAACGGGRQGPATRSTAQFDPKGSDEKALAIADQVQTALGGAANWAKVKELEWSQVIIVDGEVKDKCEHAWDMWNARHQFIRHDASGNEGRTSHDLYGDYAFAFKNKNEATRSETPALVEDATKRFNIDAYLLALPFKLKDPGVHLKYSEERPEEGSPRGSPMKYDVIKITFDSGVGPNSGDAYFIVVDKATHLPTIVEKVAAGKADDVRSGYKLTDWRDVSGLKFATKRITLGYGDEKGGQVQLKVAQGYEAGDPVPKVQVPAKAEIVWILKIQASADVDDVRYVKPVAPDRI